MNNTQKRSSALINGHMFKNFITEHQKKVILCIRKYNFYTYVYMTRTCKETNILFQLHDLIFTKFLIGKHFLKQYKSKILELKNSQPGEERKSLQERRKAVGIL